MNKKDILNNFSINNRQKILIEKYIKLLLNYNMHTNIVGKSTLIDPWSSHVLDSLQIAPFIKNKNSTILDMGTGAGLPGVMLAIYGYKNITLVDSVGKKINFLKAVKTEVGLQICPILGRLENIKNLSFDIITSRALANLNKLFTYSQKFLKKNTVLIFLKGKTVNEEIEIAKKNWIFDFSKHQSISDSRGCLIIIKNLKKI